MSLIFKMYKYFTVISNYLAIFWFHKPDERIVCHQFCITLLLNVRFTLNGNSV